ncbi:hypothetical protein F183_A51010 [Bryobacterales bacterium F-183]|nr:hypothetical protein F183_A51010 [Bryobacterales bacterium F-183]
MECLPRARAIIAGIVAATSLLQAENQWVMPSTETLHYSVEWRLVTAGNAKMVFQKNAPGANLGASANLYLESTGLVAKLFKVKDHYKSNYEGDFCAVDSRLEAQEGKRHRETTVHFDRAAAKASYLERDLIKNSIVKQTEVAIPECVKDIVGGFYQLRRLNLQPGQNTTIRLSDGKKSAEVRVEAQEWETIKTANNTKYRALRYEAFIFHGALYDRGAKAHVWISDDEKRLPVQIKLRFSLAVGTVTLQLDKEERN